MARLLSTADRHWSISQRKCNAILENAKSLTTNDLITNHLTDRAVRPHDSVTNVIVGHSIRTDELVSYLGIGDASGLPMLILRCLLDLLTILLNLLAVSLSVRLKRLTML